MTTFNDIAQSISKYTAVMIAAIMEGITLDTLKLNQGGEIDRCLALVKVCVTPDGIGIFLLNELPGEKIELLRNELKTIVLHYDFKEASSEQGSSHEIYIKHDRIFRLLFILGFDGRDVFDMYEAARLRGDIHLPPSPKPREGYNIEASAAYRQYAAIAKLTKDLEEVQAQVNFRVSQFNNVHLHTIKIKTDNLWKLITLDLGAYETVSKARAAIHHQLADVIVALDTLLKDPVFDQANERSLHNLIYEDCRAMQGLCLVYTDIIWNQFAPLEKKSPALQPAGVARVPSQDVSTSYTLEYNKESNSHEKFNVKSQAAQIAPNPITGNVQIGAIITVEAAKIAPAKRHLIFIIDVSSSMEGPKIAAARQFIAAAIEQLVPEDGFEIITFDYRASHQFSGLATPENKLKVIGQDVFNFTRGGTHLDSVAELLSTTKPMGLPAGDHQTIVMLLSDGETFGTYAASKHYQGNRGESSYVRDALFQHWKPNPRSTRFVALGFGARISPQVLEAFADDGDFLLLPDRSSPQDIISMQQAFLLKCQPFARVTMAGTVTDPTGAMGYLETTKGKRLDQAYADAITGILLQLRLPFHLVCHVLMPFLNIRQWMCISNTERITRTMKFVVPHSQMSTRLSFWTQVQRESYYADDFKEMNDITPGDAKDADLSRQVQTYENAVALTQVGATQSNHSSAVQIAEAICARAGRPK